MEDLIKTRRGKVEQDMTSEQLDALSPSELEDLEVYQTETGGWVRPSRFVGSGDEIEVIL